MHYKIIGKRVIGSQNDGDTIYVSNFKIFREGKPVPSSSIRKKALTSKGYLKARALGIDTTELHYPPPRKCEAGNRKKGVKIYPQLMSREAKEFTDSLLPQGEDVILETDEDRGKDTFYDKYDRLLVYVWTSRNGKQDKLVNLELVKQGWAFPYQISPNLRHFRGISLAAVDQMKKKHNIYRIFQQSIIPYEKLKDGKKINEPFVYRKVIDGKVCGISPRSLFNRDVFDVRTYHVYEPQEYYKVPIPYRIFLDKPV